MSSRSWAWRRCSRTCRACCGCVARLLQAALPRRAAPDVFVGIDAPEFNLRLAASLKAAGIRTVQYVSPQVWAWRQGRVSTIGESCDLVLCLLPFETDFFTRHGVRAEFVGHPLADQIPLPVDRAGARAALGIPQQTQLVAILPGSRMAEVTRLAAPFDRRRRDHRSVARPTTASSRRWLPRPLVRRSRRKSRNCRALPAIRIIDGQAPRALAAADAAIVASGTATLETLLSGRPMVVAYRVSAVTAFVLRTLGLVKVRYFSQPNLLAGRRLVPELLQEQVTGPALAEALLSELEDPQHVRRTGQDEFTRHPPRACACGGRCARGRWRCLSSGYARS